MANELRLLQDFLGGRLLYDVPTAATVVTDGVTTSGDATLTSATAAFTAADVGAPISGAGIPAGTYILTRTSATEVEMSANATATASGVSVTIDRHKVLHSTAFAAMVVVGTTQHLMAALDPDGVALGGGAPETVMVTRHDSGATWAQVSRAQEGTTSRAFKAGTDWVHGCFATDFAAPVVTNDLNSPADVASIAAGVTTTVHDEAITGAGRLGTLVSAHAACNIYGVSGTTGYAGTIEVYDVTGATVLGAGRFHNNALERQVQPSAFAQFWVPSGVTSTLRLRAANDGGSGQAIKVEHVRFQLAKVSL